MNYLLGDEVLYILFGVEDIFLRASFFGTLFTLFTFLVLIFFLGSIVSDYCDLIDLFDLLEGEPDLLFDLS